MAGNLTEQEEKFLNFYMAQTWEEMRHIENLREKVTLLVVTLASAIVGFVIQQKFAEATKPLVWFIIVLGVFGFLMVLKMYQIHQMDQKRLDHWYVYYKGFCGSDTKILKLRDQADRENAKQFKLISSIKHNHFWSALHLFIAAGGIYLLTIYPAQQAATAGAKSTAKAEDTVKQAIQDTAKNKPQTTPKH